MQQKPGGVIQRVVVTPRLIESPRERTPHRVEPVKSQDIIRTDTTIAANLPQTADEIKTLLADGYLQIHPQLWDRIPKGAHIRYIKRDTGAGIPEIKRFKPGGFVRNQFLGQDNEKMFMIESAIGGSKNDPAYQSFPLPYGSIDKLWKQYDRAAFIEIHLMYNSLSQKKKQIEDLTARVAKLESIIKHSANGGHKAT